MLAALQNLHQDMESCVQYTNKISGRFPTFTAVWQGSVESSVLFILYLAALTDVAFPRDSAYRKEKGVELLAEDGNIANTKKFQNPKSHQVLYCTYADDTALLSSSQFHERFAFCLTDVWFGSV